MRLNFIVAVIAAFVALVSADKLEANATANATSEVYAWATPADNGLMTSAVIPGEAKDFSKVMIQQQFVVDEAALKEMNTMKPAKMN
jgi:hypothetical protein